MNIADWLRGLSLERYAETFRDNATDVAALPELSEPDSDPTVADVATALLKAQVGDIVMMRTSRGTEELEIIGIRYGELP